MPTNEQGSRVSFKAFAANNHSLYESKFPFLKEAQIRAKLHQAWKSIKGKQQGTVSLSRSQVDEGAISKGLKADRALSEQRSPISNGKSSVSQRKYTVRKQQKGKISPKTPLSTDVSIRQPKSKPSVINPNSPDTCIELQTGPTKIKPDSSVNGGESQKAEKRVRIKQEEVKVFEEIQKEQLCIEYESSGDEKESEDKSERFDSKDWLQRLAEADRREKDTGNAHGMMKWRADRKINRKRENEEPIIELSRFVRSNDCEGESNFYTMFDESESIFL